MQTGLPGARSSKRAGSAVELRPAPKARRAAHPQERQLAPPKPGRGTACARPELASCGACAASRQGSSSKWPETRVARDESWMTEPRDSGREAPRARPEGDTQVRFARSVRWSRPNYTKGRPIVRMGDEAAYIPVPHWACSPAWHEEPDTRMTQFVRSAGGQPDSSS